jgi:tetratricopeptide (TPR) repeat protein
MMTPPSVRNLSGPRRLAAATAVLALLAAAPVAAVQGTTLESAIALVHDGQYAEARPALAALVTTHPRDDRIAAYLGRALFGLERYGDAMTWFEKAIGLKPDSSDHHMWLGHAALEEVQRANILRKLSLASKARRALERAVALNPANVEARGFLFAFYRQAPGIAGGSRSRARAQADEIVTLDPVRGHLARAALYEDDKDVTGAEREYLAAIAADASRAGAYLSLGQMHVRAGDYDKAFAVFDRGLKVVPGSLQILYQVGRTAALSGQRIEDGDRALREFIKRTSDKSSLSAAYWRLGLLHEHRKRPAEARAEYETALRLDPGRKEAREALRRLSR